MFPKISPDEVNKLLSVFIFVLEFDKLLRREPNLEENEANGLDEEGEVLKVWNVLLFGDVVVSNDEVLDGTGVDGDTNVAFPNDGNTEDEVEEVVFPNEGNTEDEEVVFPNEGNTEDEVEELGVAFPNEDGNTEDEVEEVVFPNEDGNTEDEVEELGVAFPNEDGNTEEVEEVLEVVFPNEGNTDVV